MEFEEKNFIAAVSLDLANMIKAAVSMLNPNDHKMFEDAKIEMLKADGRITKNVKTFLDIKE